MTIPQHSPVSLFSITTWLSRGPMPQPGIVIAKPDLALDAALVITAQARKPGQDNGITRHELHEWSMPPTRCHSERRQDRRDDYSQDVAPAGHLSQMRKPDRRDNGVASVRAAQTGLIRPCGFRSDGHRTPGLSLPDRQ